MQVSRWLRYVVIAGVQYLNFEYFIDLFHNGDQI